MLGRAKCQSRMALRGVALMQLLQAPAWRRNSPRGGPTGATRERGRYVNAPRSRVASAKQFSRGVDSNDKDLLWLLAPTKFD